MIGHVIMEIEADEMRAAVAYYLNKDVFMVEGYASRLGHKAVVMDDNDGEQSDGSDDVS